MLSVNSKIQFKITDKKNCTGCGLCAELCGKKCISLKPNILGELYPEINYDKCVWCRNCQEKCPANNEISRKSPIRSYAAWSQDENVRKKSASGGVATSIYLYFADIGGVFSGTQFDDKLNVVFELGNTVEDALAFRGSKYVYSRLNKIFTLIKERLDSDLEKKAIIIGLPCQIAAARIFFDKYPRVYYVDLVCHGVCSSRFLKDHVKAVAKNHKVDTIHFRDPYYKTKKFIFSLYSNGKLVYHSGTDSNDTYQISYHMALSYRENCYNCKYANEWRCSDITIGDYWGLGSITPFNGSKENISLVLCNTNRGLELFEDMQKNGYVSCVERPVEEALTTEQQLQNPSNKSPLQIKLHDMLMSSGGNFEEASKKILRNRIIINYIYPIQIRGVGNVLMNPEIKEKIKRLLSIK